MKTIEKPMDYDPLIVPEDHIEICAFQPCETSNQRLIMWRLTKDSMLESVEKIEGIWPFRKKIVYKYQNPWRKIEIIDAEGNEAYLSIGGVNTNLEFDMEKFIDLRNKLKTVNDVREYAYMITNENKARWCSIHHVSEFITIDNYVDEFGEDEVWK